MSTKDAAEWKVAIVGILSLDFAFGARHNIEVFFVSILRAIYENYLLFHLQSPSRLFSSDSH
jgi:hypothetical protein